jgi:hypothetical protein
MAQTNSTLTIADFAKQNGITISSKPVAKNPAMDSTVRMDHWRCTLQAGDARMKITFSKGLGHKGERPTVEEILDCCASEDWASEFGFDADSRRAEKTYNACCAQSTEFKAFCDAIAEDAYQTLLYDCERL